MRFLLTNDDGIDAEGLHQLETQLQGELWTVAPQGVESECSHRITTRRPLIVEPRGRRRWAVNGSPADCVRIALRHLCKDVHFDWVLSGINHGGNLGVDIYYSGTVAAAREATLLGSRAIAFSHYLKRDLHVDWPRAGTWAAQVFAHIHSEPLPQGSFWNINFPHLSAEAPEPELRLSTPCRLPLPVTFEATPDGPIYAGVYAQRKRTPHSDTDLCFSGHITASHIAV